MAAPVLTPVLSKAMIAQIEDIKVTRDGFEALQKQVKELADLLKANNFQGVNRAGVPYTDKVDNLATLIRWGMEPGNAQAAQDLKDRKSSFSSIMSELSAIKDASGKPTLDFSKSPLLSGLVAPDPVKDVLNITAGGKSDGKAVSPKPTMKPEAQQSVPAMKFEKKSFFDKVKNEIVDVEQFRKIPAAKDAFDKYDASLTKIESDAKAAYDASVAAKDLHDKSNNKLIDLGWVSKSVRDFATKNRDSLSQQEVQSYVETLLDNPNSQLSAEEKQKLIDAAKVAETPEDSKINPADKDKVQAARAAKAVLTELNSMLSAEKTNNDNLKADADAKEKTNVDLNNNLANEVEKAANQLRVDLDAAAKTDKSGDLGDALNAWDRGGKIREFKFAGIKSDRVSAVTGMNDLIEKNIASLKAAGKLPKAIEDAYNNGTIIDDKTLHSKEMQPFKGLIGLLNLKNEGAMEAYGEFADGLAAHAQAEAMKKAKDGKMTLPSRMGEIGFSWNEKGEPTKFFFGDNKAYHGGPEMLRLVGFVMQNGGVNIDGGKYSDEALMKAAGVSKDTVKEFFAGFPGTNGLVNKVKSGKASIDELMLGVSTNMENQMDVAQRIISGRGVKRDEMKHILMKIGSLEGLGVAAVTLATGGTASGAAANVVLNAIPMSDGLRLLIGLGTSALGVFDRRAAGVKIGNGNGNGGGGQG